MNQVTVPNLSEYLFHQSVQSGMIISLENAENLFAHRVKALGVTEEEQSLITQCVMIPHEHHCIDAQPMMIALGLITEGQSATKVQRLIERSHILSKEELVLSGTSNKNVQLASLPPSDNLQLAPSGSSENDNSTLMPTVDCHLVAVRLRVIDVHVIVNTAKLLKMLQKVKNELM